MLHVNLMEVIAAKIIHHKVGITTAQIVYALKCQKQLKHLWNQQPKNPWMSVLFHNGLVTAIAMMKTTLLTVDLMVEIVVETMSTLPTAPHVNVLNSQRQPKPQIFPIVSFHIGLVTAIVMMKTTTLLVVLMVETVVETMSTPPTAPNVHVLNKYKLYFQRIVAQIKKDTAQ